MFGGLEASAMVAEVATKPLEAIVSNAVLASENVIAQLSSPIILSRATSSVRVPLAAGF